MDIANCKFLVYALFLLCVFVVVCLCIIDSHVLFVHFYTAVSIVPNLTLPQEMRIGTRVREHRITFSSRGIHSFKRNATERNLL
jgi:hypothetical protein